MALTRVQAVCIIFVVPCYMFRPLTAVFGQPVKLYIYCCIFTVPFCKHLTFVVLLLPLALQPTVGFGLSNNVLPFFPICHQLCQSSHSQHLKISFYFLFPSFPGSSPSPSSSFTANTAHCRLWPVEQCPSIFSYLPPTLSIFSLPTFEDLFLLPLSIFSWVFPFLSLPGLE